MIITFPNGQEVDVIFDETAHSYSVAHKLADGSFSDYRPTHGITAPLEVVPKPFLTPWASKCGVDALIDEFHKNPITPDQLSQFFIDKKAMDTNERFLDDKGKDKPVMSSYRFAKLYPWYARAKSAYREKSKEGKEIGTWLHSAIEIFYNSNRKDKPAIDKFTEGLWDSFTMFDNFWKPKSSAVEFLVYSLMFGYSGQGDLLCQVNGKTCYLDFKSTNRSRSNEDGISVDNFFQGGGIAQAEFERTGKWLDDIGVVNLDKLGGEPRVIFASEFGMSPQDCAKAYISCFNNYHMIETWDYKFRKR